MTRFATLRAELVAHTVETSHGTMAGYLVRCTSSARVLGHIWSAGASWRWRTADRLHYGERSSQRSAVETLRDIADLGRGNGLPTAKRPPRLPMFEDREPSPLARAPRPVAPKPVAQPCKVCKRPTAAADGVCDRHRWAHGRPEPTIPTPPRIVWNDQAPAIDLHAIVRDALNKKGGGDK